MKLIYLFVLVIFILYIDISNCDNLLFVGDKLNKQSFLNKTVWSPEKVPTKDDSIELSNGGIISIDVNINGTSEYFKINDGSIFLNGELNIINSLELNKGIISIGSNGIINVGNSITVKDKIEITNDPLQNSKNTSISTNNFIISENGFFNIYKNSKLSLNSITLELNNDSLINIEENSVFYSSNLIKLDHSSSITANQVEIWFVSINSNSQSNIQVSESKINVKGPLIMNDQSTIVGDKIELDLDSIEGNSDASIIYDNSNIVINGDTTLKNQAKLYTTNTSISGYGNIVLNDNSKFSVFDSSQMSLLGDLVLNDNSKVSLMNKAEVQLYGNFKMDGDSSFFIYGPESIVYIYEEFNCSEKSQFILDSSSFFVLGDVSFKGNTLFNSGYFKLSKLATWDGDILGVDSTFIVDGSLIINSKTTKLQDSIIYSYSDLLINGEFEAYGTTVFIEDGNSILTNASYLKLDHSIIIISKGNLIVHPDAYVNIQDSEFLLDNGIVETLGNVYLNNKSSLKNQNGTYNLSSGIYYSNDTTIKTNNITLMNDGIFNIVKDNAIINVAFTNSGNDSIGQLNINNHTIYIYQFRNENGSELNLNGGTLSSDNSIELNGGSIKGNGNLNSSIIQTNGEFGSRTHVNNFNISGDFIQSNDSSSIIIIIIDSLDSFSTIDIGKLADISGIVIIKINENLLNNSRENQLSETTTTAKTSSMAASSSSSSSSRENSPTTLKLVSFNNKTDNSFGNIQFQTYDSNGNEKDLNKVPCVEPKVSGTSFSLLIDVSDCDPSDNEINSLSVGAIVGIIIACAVVSIIIMSIIHYRKRVRFMGMLAKLKLSKMSKKLSRK
ncbi:hypothetical protein ACTA71_006244 [Dictyostelium dimigraforme]